MNYVRTFHQKLGIFEHIPAREVFEVEKWAEHGISDLNNEMTNRFPDKTVQVKSEIKIK